MKAYILLFASASAWAGTSLPLWFEPNEGQAHASVQFLSRSVYLGSGRAAIHAGGDKPLVMSLVGARKEVVAEGLGPLPGITSYFIGNDPKKWRSGVPHFAKVRYRDVYPGIDLIYYSNAEGKLEYDLVVAPGADPGRIQIAYNDPVREGADGDLLIAGVRQKRPKVYQGSHEVRARYLVRDRNRVQVALGDYDHSQTLTVDPVLVYSTYLGGPGLETGTAIAVDGTGNEYFTGYARAPAQPGLNPFQQTFGLNYNAFVIKLAPGGNSLVYYIFIGDQWESGYDISVDSTGAAWLAGETRSFAFPVKNPIQATYGGGFADGFVSKISPDGKALLFSSYLGGPALDKALGITVDTNGNAYVALETEESRLPTGKTSFQPQGVAGLDGYVTKLSPQGAWLWGTYLAGSGLDSANAIAVDSSGDVYVAGATGSDDFPTTRNSFLPARPQPGSASGFVSKLNGDGSTLLYWEFWLSSGGKELTA